MTIAALSHIHSIPAGPMREAAAVARLLEDDPARLLEQLALTMRLAVCGSKLAQEVNDAISAARCSPASSTWLERLTPHSAEHTPYWLRAWLGDGPAARALPPLGRLFDYGNKYASSAQQHHLWRGCVLMSDGIARLRYCNASFIRRLFVYEHSIHRMLFHDDPAFLSMMLSVAPLRVREVVEVAARRPTRVALQEVIAQSKWIKHEEVRVALCANPYTAMSVVLGLAPTLSGPQLKSLGEDEHQSAHVRALARGLWCEQHRGVHARVEFF